MIFSFCHAFNFRLLLSCSAEFVYTDPPCCQCGQAWPGRRASDSNRETLSDLPMASAAFSGQSTNQHQSNVWLGGVNNLPRGGM